jgi:hypothetical protein
MKEKAGREKNMDQYRKYVDVCRTFDYGEKG